MMKKFEFTGETKTIQLEFKTVTLHRIRAVADFGLVKIGDIGGWLEKEENLSHEGNAWVYDNAVVCGNAKVSGNAEVCGNAYVCGNALVWGNAEVSGNALVWGNTEVYGNALVWGNTEVYGDAKISDNAKVYGNAKVSDNALVSGNAEVYSDAKVSDNAEVWDARHVMIIGAIGSRSDFTTFYRGKDKQIMVKCGCFNDTIDEFVDKVKQTHGNNKYARVYIAAVEVARLQILEGKAKESEDKE